MRVFTVAEVVDTTRLNPESVRTELQRMKEQGLLTSERQGRQCRYSLTEDPEKRLALSQSLHAFLPVAGVPAPADLAAPCAANPPASEAYRQAQQCLDAAMNPKSDDCAGLLAEAKELLEQAAREEGYVSASEAALSYLGYERARLAYLLGRQEAAAHSFRALRPFFERIGDADTVQYIDEFLIVIKLEADRVDFAAGGPQRELNAYLQKYRSRGPLSRLVDMLDPALDASRDAVTPASLGLSHVATFLDRENLLDKKSPLHLTAALAA